MIDSRHEYICEGCDRSYWDGMSRRVCGVYAYVPPYYIRTKCCPFNKMERTVPKVKVRVGQQKTRRQHG